jgi:hypothetical protein
MIASRYGCNARPPWRQPGRGTRGVPGASLSCVVDPSWVHAAHVESLGWSRDRFRRRRARSTPPRIAVGWRSASIPPQPAARPRCVAKVNRRGWSGRFSQGQAQSNAVTANSGRVASGHGVVASGHGVVASGHGVAKYAMLPPLHRCPVDVCSRHEHQNSVSVSPLTSLARGGFHGGSRLDATVTVPPYTTAQYSTAPHPITSPGAAGDRAGPVQRRSELVHARRSFTLRARSRSELVS